MMYEAIVEKAVLKQSGVNKRDERKRTYRRSDEKTSCCQNLRNIVVLGMSVAVT